MTAPGSRLECAGCGWIAPDAHPYPFRCLNAGLGDDTDHVMARILDSTARFPEEPESNPFLGYRGLLHSFHLWGAYGRPEVEYEALVRDLDTEVARVAGSGFTATPFARSTALSERLGFGASGGVWIKDETNNVAGSHKSRHLMGLLIHLTVVDRLGLTEPGTRPRLAIASCGNAALAAAVMAAAGRFPLEVFVPPDADPIILERLRDTDANVVVCPREREGTGDPTMQRLLEAIGEGALAFTCQGHLNGLAIEGGETLAYEMASSIRQQDWMLDHMFLQVGGGALASATMQGLREAGDLGVGSARPRMHTLQTQGAHPLQRAYGLVMERLGPDPSPQMIQGVLRYAATHRSEFMWPWEERPLSAATGILDDETYDWLAAIRGMIETRGEAVVVDEDDVLRAQDLARQATGIDVDPTGSAGLAGLLAQLDEGTIGAGDRVAILFTGRALAQP